VASKTVANIEQPQKGECIDAALAERGGGHESEEAEPVEAGHGG